MTEQHAAAARVAAVYNAASDRYTAPPLSFWDRFGKETVRRLGLRSGAVDAVTPEQVNAVRDAVLGELRRRNVRAVTTSVVYSHATRGT